MTLLQSTWAKLTRQYTYINHSLNQQFYVMHFPVRMHRNHARGATNAIVRLNHTDEQCSTHVETQPTMLHPSRKAELHDT